MLASILVWWRVRPSCNIELTAHQKQVCVVEEMNSISNQKFGIRFPMQPVMEIDRPPKGARVGEHWWYDIVGCVRAAHYSNSVTTPSARSIACGMRYISLAPLRSVDLFFGVCFCFVFSITFCEFDRCLFLVVWLARIWRWITVQPTVKCLLTVLPAFDRNSTGVSFSLASLLRECSLKIHQFGGPNERWDRLVLGVRDCRKAGRGQLNR